MSIEIQMRNETWRVKLLHEEWDVPDTKELYPLIKQLVEYKQKYAIKNFKPKKE